MVDVIDLATPSASTQTSLPGPMSGLAAASIGTRAFFAGGFRDLMYGTNYASDAMHVFDCVAGTWSVGV